MSILEKLTEGMVPRDLHAESHALVEKWERTGLLEGLGNDEHKNQMSRLLENQAKELLRESSAMAQGDVEGFAAVAFPLVRRVFGSLVAQDLVSVQPMSLPSGLIFFLDFTFSPDGGMTNSARLGNVQDTSIYGGGRVAQQITGGVVLTQDNAEAGPYSLNNGFSSPTGSGALVLNAIASGTAGDTTELFPGTGISIASLTRHDPDIPSGSVAVYVGSVAEASLGQLNTQDYVGITVNNGTMGVFSGLGGTGTAQQVRRLTHKLSASSPDLIIVGVDYSSATATNAQMTEFTGSNDYTWPITDNFVAGTGIPGSVAGTTLWGLEGDPSIPEIDIKVDSVSVTALTKKLKAKWTPELGQDLNAYHNLDAEVELTSILSEQIALEIDREILEDLVKGATADTLHWSRRPGKFVDSATGVDLTANGTVGPDFTGNVSEWYETLLETINDVSAQIHRKTLRGGANFVVVSPEMANILEFTAGFRAAVTHDDDRGTIGAVKVGSLSKKFDVYVDPYFIRNVCLVGRKGGSFLESGYVYAPYVPLQVTPTIFGVEDFVPRKGVMTRYAKQMVRGDMYGLVIVQDFLG